MLTTSGALTDQTPARAQDTDLARSYDAVRRLSESLCEPLETEDFVIQSMPDVSPTRWHLAHTTWLFETFILTRHFPGYRPFNPEFTLLFNSYYNAVGEQFPRPRRGVLSRPTVREVMDYRAYVDRHMLEFLEGFNAASHADLAYVIAVGLSHEQQHQELMLTDIKHVFSCNPLYPVYLPGKSVGIETLGRMNWQNVAEGLIAIGNSGDRFCYDNERPRHREFVDAFEFADRLVTNADYIRFIEARGYERPEYWLSDGWSVVRERSWLAPLYWVRRDGEWWNYSLSGMRRVDPAEPVCHVSFFEADAYARWAGVRLPTEVEWEIAAANVAIEGNFVENGTYHPIPLDAAGSAMGPYQLFGDVWEWTASPYVGYPGYRPPDGALGEYNGKFMCNQFVLRGGSCATPRSHVRLTYRNFFPPDARWQFSGIRLAR